MIDLYEDLGRIGAALDAVGVEWALCGGLAVAVHGAPRATADIDILVLPLQVEAAIASVRPLGYRFLAAPMRFPDGMAIRRVSRVVEGDVVTLDLLLVEGALQGVFDARARIDTEKGSVSVVSREGLIQMKTWAARPRDLEDVRRLSEDDR